MRAAWRNAGFLGAVLFLHAILVAVLPFARRARPVRPVAPPAEIEIEATAIGNEAPVGNGGATAGATAVNRGHVDRGRTRGQNQSEPSVTVEGTTPNETANEGNGEPLPSVTGPQSIGLDGPGSFRMDIAKQLPDEKTQAADDLHRAFTDPHRGDRTSGPVAQELERTTRRLDGTPFVGRAVFSVDVDDLGLVVAVKVSETSGDQRAWEEVARAVLNAFAQKRLQVPPGAKRVAMQIEIASRVALPSGAEHPMTVESPAVQGLSRIAQGQFDRPGDTPAIVAGSFDVSDIGSHPQRVVGARVLWQQAF